MDLNQAINTSTKTDAQVGMEVVEIGGKVTPADRDSTQVISGINMQQNAVIEARGPVTPTLHLAERRVGSPDQPRLMQGQRLEGTGGPRPGLAAHTEDPSLSPRRDSTAQ